MILALLLTVVAVDDPRPELIQLQLEGQTRAALDRVDRSLVESEEKAREWGFEYLRGHLLERLAEEKAAEAFAIALTSTPALAAHSRYRLALSQLQMGHPEVAAGLFATLLAENPPSSLIPTAVRLFSYALSQGGDCRLLATVDHWHLPREQSRTIELAKSRCAWQAGNFQLASELATELLKQSREDESARGAAVILSDLIPPTADSATLLRIGLTFHYHREFELAVPFLQRGIAAIRDGQTGLRGVDREDALYELARAHFWLENYSEAARLFLEVTATETVASKQARALFQRGRSIELEGDWDAANESYRQAFAVTPTSSWTPAAILAALRVDWRLGREDSALALLDHIRSRGGWQSLANRALLFAAASDLVRGRTDRASGWLEQARRSLGSDDLEVTFWRAVLAELEGDSGLAVQRYALVLSENSYHPLGVATRRRLADSQLRPAVEEEAGRLAASNRVSDLYKAWLLLGPENPTGNRARERVAERWHANSQAQPFLSPAIVAPSDWPIWDGADNRPEAMLLRLGIVEQMSTEVRRYFPQGDTPFALTGSQLLSTAGLYQPSLYLAEVTAKRLPEGVPEQLLPLEYRKLLYPRPYRELVELEGRRQGVDPNLLNAIIREESRFNPLAISAASARGLTQFVLPTARLVSTSLGWKSIDAVDLHRPEISIALGAAYIAQLSTLFEGRSEPAIAAYNAGDKQAALWQAYCHTKLPEEYYTKVGFTQTRNYLRKVASSREHYREIYRTDPPDKSP